MYVVTIFLHLILVTPYDKNVGIVPLLMKLLVLYSERLYNNSNFFVYGRMISW